jgi:putative tricarboxylic transport membrane protein
MWDGYDHGAQGRAGQGAGLVASFSALVRRPADDHGDGAGLGKPVAGLRARPFPRRSIFAIIFFGLASVVTLGGGSITNAAISLMPGPADRHRRRRFEVYGAERFAFGVPFLQDGIEYLLVMVGAYGFGRGVHAHGKAVSPVTAATADKGDGAASIPNSRRLAEMIKLKMPASSRSAADRGSWSASCPGRRRHRRGLRRLRCRRASTARTRALELGSGIAEGIVAPQTAATARRWAARIDPAARPWASPAAAPPPSSSAPFLLHGMQPGPQVFVTSRPLRLCRCSRLDVRSAVIGMCIIGYFAIKPLVKVLEAAGSGRVSAFVVLFCFIGAFAASNNLSDLYVITAFGILGYLFEKFKFPHRADGAGRRSSGRSRKVQLHDHDGQPRQRLDGTDSPPDQRHGHRARFAVAWP